MSEFDRRWKRLTGLAGSQPAPLPDPPLHAASRWMALARRGGEWSGANAGDLWMGYGLRGLAVSVLLLAACLVWAGWGAVERPLRRPPIENVVAETFWML